MGFGVLEIFVGGGKLVMVVGLRRDRQRNKVGKAVEWKRFLGIMGGSVGCVRGNVRG